MINFLKKSFIKLPHKKGCISKNGSKIFIVSFIVLIFSHASISSESDAKFNLYGGLGYLSTNITNDKVIPLAYNIGGRIELPANDKKSAGIELGFLSNFNNDFSKYLSLGIVLEQEISDIFSTSIGTVGYLDLKNGGTSPFGITSGFHFKLKDTGRFDTYISIRNDYIFSSPVLVNYTVGIRYKL